MPSDIFAMEARIPPRTTEGPLIKNDFTHPGVVNWRKVEGAWCLPHLHDFLDVYNCGRRLKTPHGLTPYEHICKIRATEPQRFILDPHHKMLGLHT